MPSTSKTFGPVDARFTIPAGILRKFEQEPRFVFKPFPGILLLDAKILHDMERLEKLVTDKAITENFDIVLMPKR